MRRSFLLAVLALTFSIPALAQSRSIVRDPRYPAHWWTPVSKEGAPSWEILPQEAGPGEVILLSTGNLILKPDHYEEPHAAPEWRYFEMLTTIRSQSRRRAFAERPAFTLQSENDEYLGWGDDDYTNGLRLSFDWSQAVLWSRLAPRLKDCKDERVNDTPCRRTTIMIGQNFYTPRNITIPVVQEDERPYSAWLYVGLAARLAEPKRLRSVELQIGTTGKLAQGEYVQTRWHALVDAIVYAPEPKGWAHQTKPVPGAVGIIASWDYKVAREHRTRGTRPYVKADVVPYYRVSLGNVHDFAAGGATARYGYNLQRRWAEKIGPTFLVAGQQPVAGPAPRNGEFYVYGAVEGRAVAWNALLQHDTYTPRRLAPISRGVADLETGVGWGYKRVSGGFRLVWRSPEFDHARWNKFAGPYITFGPRVQ